MYYLFVYGTLRTEFNPVQRIGDFIRKAKIKGTMYDLGTFPGVTVEGEDEIVGEIVKVDKSDIVALDKYENVPKLYTRELVNTIEEPGLESYEVYVYNCNCIKDEDKKFVIKNGDWVKHQIDYYIRRAAYLEHMQKAVQKMDEQIANEVMGDESTG